MDVPEFPADPVGVSNSGEVVTSSPVGGLGGAEGGGEGSTFGFPFGGGALGGILYTTKHVPHIETDPTSVDVDEKEFCLLK